MERTGDMYPPPGFGLIMGPEGTHVEDPDMVAVGMEFIGANDLHGYDGLILRYELPSGEVVEGSLPWAIGACKPIREMPLPQLNAFLSVLQREQADKAQSGKA